MSEVPEIGRSPGRGEKWSGWRKAGNKKSNWKRRWSAARLRPHPNRVSKNAERKNGGPADAHSNGLSSCVLGECWKEYVTGWERGILEAGQRQRKDTI